LPYRWRAACWLLAFGLCLGTPAAHAQTSAPSLNLVWEAPEGCPEHARVLAQVEALLGAERETVGALEARAKVTHADDGSFALSLSLASANGVDERHLVGDSCQALVDSVAVMLAMQLQPTPEVAAPKPAPAHEPEPPAARPAPQSRPQQRARQLRLGLSGAGDSVALPRFGLGARLELGWVSERWYVAFATGAWLPQEQGVRQGHAGSGRFSWLAGALTLCHASWGNGVRIGPCLAAEAGQLSAESRGVRAPARAHELWLAAHGGLSFWVPLGSRFLLQSSLATVVPLWRPRFVIEGIGEIHQPRALGARSTIGITACF
jgi:hypothetical protein